MNVIQMQFLDVSMQVGKSRWRAGVSEEVSDKAEEGDGFESKVYYSITHKVQFNANCKMIS